MDSAHEVELSRILENRRRRGVAHTPPPSAATAASLERASGLLQQPPPSQQQQQQSSITTGGGSSAVPPSSSYGGVGFRPLHHNEGATVTSIRTTVDAPAPLLRSSQPNNKLRHVPPSSMAAAAAPRTITSSTAAGAAASLESRDSQMEQLSSELKEMRGLLSNVLQQQQHQRHSGQRQPTRRSAAVEEPSSSSAAHLVSTPATAKYGSPSAHPQHQQQHHHHHSLQPIPNPIIPLDEFSPTRQYPPLPHPQRVAHPRDGGGGVVVAAPGVEAASSSSRYGQVVGNHPRGDAPGGHSYGGGGGGPKTRTTTQQQGAPSPSSSRGLPPPPPPPPPRNAKPFARTTMDIESSFAIVREGDWFYKWDQQGLRIKIRWVWFDVFRQSFSWSSKEAYDSMWLTKIPLTDVAQVVMEQVEEQDPQGVTRVIYVLVLKCRTRELRLGTEKRDKADAWYEALQNLISYTVHSMRPVIAELSSTD